MASPGYVKPGEAFLLASKDGSSAELAWLDTTLLPTARPALLATITDQLCHFRGTS